MPFIVAVWLFVKTVDPTNVPSEYHVAVEPPDPGVKTIQKWRQTPWDKAGASKKDPEPNIKGC
jgi:hypothetical protein